MTLPSSVEVGLAVTAKDNTKVAQAVIDGVSMTGTEITTPPPAPTGLAATNASVGQVSLSWAAASTATSYTVKRSNVSGGPFSTVAASVTSTTYLDFGLTEGASYYYVVSASNLIGESLNSSQVAVTLSVAAATTTYPAEDSTHVSYGGGASLDSNNAGFNGTGFINFPTSGGFLQFINVNGGGGGNAAMSIRYALGSGTRTGALIVNGVSQAISFPGTGAFTTWQNLTVAVTLNSGASNTIRLESNGQDLANIDEITVAPTPPAPLSLTATSGSGEISLTWTLVGGASSYLVKRSTNSGSGYASLGTPTTNSFTDSGLGDGATRYYLVCAVNANGTGPNSPESSATTYTPIENWRLTNFGSPANHGNAADNVDPDSDGWTNAQEFTAGTDPNDRTSSLRIAQMAANGNDLLVSFPTVLGKTYRLDCSATLQVGSWTTVQDNISGTGLAIQVTDPGGATQPVRFYRLVVR